jgi:SAM-dependent methyltransferase
LVLSWRATKLKHTKEGKYSFPNDEPENDRLDLQHHLFILTLDGKLYTAPIPKEKSLHRVLDVGTGTGIWAIDFADEHPESQVIGIDLSPIQPSFIPPNLKFEIDDLEEPWTFPEPFDFIFSRMMVASFANFPRFFEQSFKNLTPGGWMECMDICNPVKADDDSMPPDSALLKWCVSCLFYKVFVC